MDALAPCRAPINYMHARFNVMLDDYTFSFSPCSDGCGRSGTFLSVYSAIDRFKVEAVVDVFQCVKSARIQRMALVANTVSTIYTPGGLIVDHSPHSTVPTYQNIQSSHSVEGFSLCHVHACILQLKMSNIGIAVVLHTCINLLMYLHACTHPTPSRPLHTHTHRSSTYSCTRFSRIT